MIIPVADGTAGTIERIEATPAPGGDTLRVTPGLIDIQVNGFAGVDFNDADICADDLEHALEAMLATGVTGCLPTVITAPPERMAQRLQALDRAVWGSRLGPWMVRGYHLEGPFLCPDDGFAGCHPADAMIPASMEAFEHITEGLKKPVLMITVAPERPGVIDFIAGATERGILVGIGHTSASGTDIDAAIGAGARISCHLGNGLPRLLDKKDNPLLAQLGDDRLHASFIADGIHIPVHVLKSLMRAKQVPRCVLVTDATASAAAAPGVYTLGDVIIERAPDGTVRQPGADHLAGSSATMDEIASNVMEWFGHDLDTVITMARTNPLGLLGEKSTPAVGDMAEAVWWRQEGGRLKAAAAQVGPWRYEEESINA
jgi:N-acetylglucosamine-6-phosphate deacetylase